MTFLEKRERESRIHGFGIFTNRLIKKGEIFYKIPLTKTSSKPKSRWACIGKNKWVSDEKVLNWINHSCDPNSELCLLDDFPKLLALRDIVIGEEITVDYNKTETGGAEIKCLCKSKKCKGSFMRIE